MNRRTVGPVLFLLVSILGSVWFVPYFGTSSNLRYLLIQAVPLLLLATGQTIVIITSGIDLSVGQTVTLGACVASGLMDPGMGLWLALVVCVLLGVVVGGANGVMIERFNLPPFLATLGTTFFLIGVNLFLRPAPGGYIPSSFQAIAKARLGDIPVAALVTLLAIAALGIFIDRSRFGLRLHAVGSDERRARLAGVPSGWIKYVAYIISAELAIAAGLFIAARTGTGDPLVGSSFQLSSITAAVLGGAALTGGQGTVWGAVIGAFVLGMISNVLNLLGVVAYWQWVIQGIVLILAVSIYSVEIGNLPSKIRLRRSVPLARDAGDAS
jgi:ribose transport system permease protein